MAHKESFITIQGWMATELNLSGNELLVYALIYGFSQDGESEFRGSINYICGWLNCSRPTAMKALNNLVENGLISKRVKIENNVTFNRYKVILQGVKKLYRGSKETLPGGSKETLHHNISLDNIKDNIENSNFKNSTPKHLNDMELLEVRECRKVYDQNYTLSKEQICISMHIGMEKLKHLQDNFDSMLIATGTIHKHLKDYASHFGNWAKKQNPNEVLNKANTIAIDFR